jgi:hypothetical protein
MTTRSSARPQIAPLVRQMRAEHPNANPFDVAEALAAQFGFCDAAWVEAFVQIWIAAVVCA